MDQAGRYTLGAVHGQRRYQNPALPGFQTSAGRLVHPEERTSATESRLHSQVGCADVFFPGCLRIDL
jgi:hypothetical protein